MGIEVVWKIGSTARSMGLHAFMKEADVGSRAACRADIKSDGEPLFRAKNEPHCKRCVERLAKLDEWGITQFKVSIAGSVRSKYYWERVNKTHWWIERHGGRRRDKWRRVQHSDSKTGIEYLFHQEAELLKEKGVCRRGGVRLVDPDRRVERIFIKSSWLKEDEHVDGSGTTGVEGGVQTTGAGGE